MKPVQITMFSPKPMARRLAKEDTPVYRIANLGPQVCTLTEIIAALVRGPNSLELAAAIVDRWPTPGQLHRASIQELQGIYGIGESSAAAIKAALELGRRVMNEMLEERPAIHGPADADALVQCDMSALEQEEL